MSVVVKIHFNFSLHALSYSAGLPSIQHASTPLLYHLGCFCLLFELHIFLLFYLLFSVEHSRDWLVSVYNNIALLHRLVYYFSLLLLDWLQIHRPCTLIAARAVLPHNFNCSFQWFGWPDAFSDLLFMDNGVKFLSSTAEAISVFSDTNFSFIWCRKQIIAWKAFHNFRRVGVFIPLRLRLLKWNRGAIDVVFEDSWLL